MESKEKLPLRLGVGIVLLNDKNYVFVGKRIDNATPSTPAVILGLSGAPEVGDEVLSAVNDKKIREIAEFRKAKIRDNKFASQYQAPTLDNIFSNLKKGEIPTFNILFNNL